MGKVTERQYFERILAEMDRRYDQRFIDAEKLTNASFASSEKAIVKAEEAQREYNVRSNEFRGQLDDQKTEANSALERIREDIKVLQASGNVMTGKLWAPMLVVGGIAAAIGAAMAKLVFK